VIVRRREPGAANLDLWMLELSRGTTTRFTFDPGDDGNPVWSADGSRIYWSGSRGDASAILSKSTNGVGEETTIMNSGAFAAPSGVSRDGKHLLYTEFGAETRADVCIVNLTGDPDPRKVVSTPFFEGLGRFSPDGRWMAYQSLESGRPEVFVVSTEGPAGKWQVSTRGGFEPTWSADGRELFYVTDDFRIMAVPILPGPTFQPGTPQQLFTTRFELGIRRNVYCVAPDGRFLFLVPVGETNTPMTAVINWRAGVGRR
jgi:Tol biopolymer transport system component